MGHQTPTNRDSEGVLSDPSGSLVIKPCTPIEVSFYESALSEHPRFAAFMPTFMGTLTLSGQSHQQEPEGKGQGKPMNLDAVKVAPKLKAGMAMAGVHRPVKSSELPLENAGPLHGARLETDLAIVLENAAWGFTRPNVLDVKLGSQLWDSSASLSKRARLDKVASETTSSSLGFRIAGMKVWQDGAVPDPETTGEDRYKVYDKMYGRKFTADDVIEGFKDFFAVKGASSDGDELSRVMARRLGDEVSKIRSVLEAEESRMYSASVLFVYEGDGAVLKEQLEQERQRAEEQEQARSRTQNTRKTDEDHSRNPEDDKARADEEEQDDNDDDDEDEDEPRRKIHHVKLIDFAHAKWTPGQGPDENALKGVRNVERILAEFCRPSDGKRTPDDRAS